MNNDYKIFQTEKNQPIAPNLAETKLHLEHFQTATAKNPPNVFLNFKPNINLNENLDLQEFNKNRTLMFNEDLISDMKYNSELNYEKNKEHSS